MVNKVKDDISIIYLQPHVPRNREGKKLEIGENADK